MKNLLILDLESTCFERGKEPAGFISEIIEIGAVILDTTTLQVVDEYQCFVKPSLTSVLTDFCKELTTITQEEVDNGISIEQALAEIGTFAKKYDSLFCSWGFYDQKQFERVCKTFKQPYPFVKGHVSVKHQHGTFYNKKPMGMERALTLHDIPLDGTHHRGIDDARNIAKIATKMLQDGWKPEI